MLLHSGVQGHIIVLDPASQGMQEENRVLVAKLQQLLSSVLEQNNVTVVQWVPQLEGVNCVSTSLDDLIIDLSGCLSVLIHAVLEFDLAHISNGGTTDQVVSLGQDPLYLGVLN